jgi:hypothetical protein
MDRAALFDRGWNYAEWNDIVRDLDRVEQVTIEQEPKRFMLRPQAPGCAGAVFKAVGVALPPLIQQIRPRAPPPAEAPPSTPRRRESPRRGAPSSSISRIHVSYHLVRET